MTKTDLLEVLENPLDAEARWEYVSNQPGVTVRNDGVIVGVGGINWYWEGVGEAWVILAKDAKPVTAYRSILRMFKSLLKNHEWRRVQAVVRASWTKANRMAERLGFQREGLMKNYCPNGEDAVMYAIVKDESC
jgi:RimJ/RimL family protein N-acetyltransferase